MNNLTRIAFLSLAVMLCLVSPLFAQEAKASSLIEFSGAIGVGLVAIAGAFGIGKLASAALESMARQPEVAGNIQVAMIIAAALIEGFTFYALYICSTQNPWAQG